MVFSFSIVESGIPSINTNMSTVAVSHHAIMPPVWAMLPSDTHPYECPAATTGAPSQIPLGDSRRCICGATTTSNQNAEFQPAKLYGLTGVHTLEIKLQACSVCPRAYHRYVGPDGCDLGIFNLNNQLLFTHDLLDDYTASFTSSETPFTAWANVVWRRYLRHGSLEPFVRDAVFLQAWFSYSNLQDMEGDMSCPACGPAPDNVIWDGVSISFHRKHLLPSLQPPTMVHKKSVERQSTRVSQMLIEASDICRNLRKIIESTGSTSGDSDSDVAPSLGELMAKLELQRVTVSALKEINWEVGKYFDTYYGVDAMATRRKPGAAIGQLFMQVHCSIQESICT